MITFTEFKELINQTRDFHCKIMEMHKLGIDIDNIIYPLETVNQKLWEYLLTAEGADWVAWFLYERGWAYGIEVFKLKKYLKAYDKNKKEICKDIGGLYDLLKKDNYLKNTK